MLGVGSILFVGQVAMNKDEVSKQLTYIKIAIGKLERALEAVPKFDPQMIYYWTEDKKLAPVLKAIARAESNFNPEAVSRAGAEGLMQLMPAIQEHFKVEDPFDPKQSVKAAEKLFREELDRFGDLHLAIAAYNAGSPTVSRALAKTERRTFSEAKVFLPEETQKYVPKVIGFYDMYRDGEPIVA